MRRLILPVLMAALMATPATAQLASPVRVGVLTDETGPYADAGGAGSVAAARLAAADMGGMIDGQPIEIVHGDTLNKPDVASTIARRWFDTDGVSAVVDLPVTPIALAVQQLAREKNRTVMITGAAISEFTSKLCSRVSSHWADDTHASPLRRRAPCWTMAARAGSSSQSTWPSARPCNRPPLPS